MNRCFEKLKLIGIAFASAMMLWGCGGADDAPAPVPDVVVVWKNIPIGERAVTTELMKLQVADVKILDIRCASLLPPAGVVGPASIIYVLLLDMSAADAEKAQAFGFKGFGPEEQARKSAAVCS